MMQNKLTIQSARSLLWLVVFGLCLMAAKELPAHQSSVKVSMTATLRAEDAAETHTIVMGGVVHRVASDSISILVPRFCVDLENPLGPVAIVRMLRRSEINAEQTSLQVEIDGKQRNATIRVLPPYASQWVVVVVDGLTASATAKYKPVSETVRTKKPEIGESLSIAYGESKLVLSKKANWEVKQDAENVEIYRLPLSVIPEDTEQRVPFGSLIVDENDGVVGAVLPDKLEESFKKLLDSYKATENIDIVTQLDAQEIVNAAQKAARKKAVRGFLGFCVSVFRLWLGIANVESFGSVLQVAASGVKAAAALGDAIEGLSGMQIPDAPYAKSLLAITAELRRKAKEEFDEEVKGMQLLFRPGVDTREANIWWDDRYGVFTFPPSQDWQLSTTNCKGSTAVFTLGARSLVQVMSRTAVGSDTHMKFVREQINEGAYAGVIGKNAFYQEHNVEIKMPRNYIGQTGVGQETVARRWDLSGKTFNGEDVKTAFFVVWCPGQITMSWLLTGVEDYAEDAELLKGMWERAIVVPRELRVISATVGSNQTHSAKYLTWSRNGTAQPSSRSVMWQLGDRIKLQVGVAISGYKTLFQSKLTDEVLLADNANATFFEMVRACGDGRNLATNDQAVNCQLTIQFEWGHPQLNAE